MHQQNNTYHPILWDSGGKRIEVGVVPFLRKRSVTAVVKVNTFSRSCLEKSVINVITEIAKSSLV